MHEALKTIGITSVVGVAIHMVSVDTIELKNVEHQFSIFRFHFHFHAFKFVVQQYLYLEIKINRRNREVQGIWQSIPGSPQPREQKNKKETLKKLSRSPSRRKKIRGQKQWEKLNA